MNWTSPLMFELLLDERPRKPVGPEDAIFAGFYEPWIHGLGCVFY
jgi:hypothetical protein